MSRRCPPGVICIENITICMIIIIVLGVMLYLQIKHTSANEQIKHTSANEQIIVEDITSPTISGLYPTSSFDIFNTNDVLMNPYQAPLRNDSLYQKGIPINIRTQGIDSNYRQVGILTRNNNGELILPLMGRPLLTNRDKWQFYTMNDKNNMIKLPVTFKGKSCTNEYGCDNIYNGDTVYIEGFNDTFKATIYDNDVMRYIPYL